MTRFDHDAAGNIVRVRDSLSGQGGSVASYEFDGTLGGVGGPALTSVGPGQFQNDTVFGVQRPVYAFAKGSGLTLDTTGLIPADNYSLELVMRFDETSGYRKIVDFEDLTLDSGFYQRSGQLNFFPSTSGNTFLPNVYQHIVLTRLAADRRVTAYINGVQAWTFIDDQSRADIQNAGNLLHFFLDDVATSRSEASAGRVVRLRVYDAPLDPDEVADRAQDPLAGVGTGRGERTFAYDATFNRVTQVIDESGQQTLSEIDAANGNLLAVTNVIGDIGGADDVVTQYTYTEQGLLDTMTDPLGRITHYVYNVRGLLTQITYAQGTPDQAIEQFEYDSNAIAGRAGLVTARIDGNNHRTAYEYDALNRRVRMIESDPDGAGPLATPATSWEYDAAGNVVKLTDPRGNVTTMEYDALQRLVKTTSPDPDCDGSRLAGHAPRL